MKIFEDIITTLLEYSVLYLALAAVIILLIIVYILYCRKCRRLAHICGMQTAEEVKGFIHQLNNYIPHRLLTSSSSEMRFPAFLREIKSQRCVLILGPSGSGKTALMRQAASHMSHIIYYSLSRTDQTLESILFELKQMIKKSASKEIHIFLDGFDELKEVFDGKESDWLLSSIPGAVESWNIPKKKIQIIISCRRDLFNNTEAATSTFAVYDLQPFTPSQVRSCYEKSDTRSFRYRGTYNVPELSSSKNILKKGMDSGVGVFTLPILIPYIDILEEQRLARGSDSIFIMNLREVLDAVILRYWPIREYNSYLDSKKDGPPLSVYQYQDKFTSCLLKLVAQAVKNKENVLRTDSLDEETRNYLENQSEFFARYTTVHADHTYKFIHNIFMDYFTATYLADRKSCCSDRNLWFIQKRTPYTYKLYLSMLENQRRLCTKLLSSCEGVDDISELMDAKRINFTENPPMDIQSVLDYLVKAQTFSWGDIDFDQQDTYLLSMKGVLDLGGHTLENLSSVNAFGKLSELYLDNNRITDLSEYQYLEDLKILDLTNNPFDDYEQLSPVHLDTLLISLNEEEKLESLIHHVKFEHLIIDTDNMSALYQRIFALREEQGLDIVVRRGALATRTILLRYVKMYDYSFDNLMKIFILDTLYNPANPKNDSLSLLLANSLLAAATKKRAIKDDMVKVLGNMGMAGFTPESLYIYTPANNYGDPAALPKFNMDDFDMSMLNDMETACSGLTADHIIKNAFVNLHKARFHYIRMEYKDCVNALETSGIILKRVKCARREEQLFYIRVLSYAINIEPYYEIYAESNRQLGNSVEELRQEDDTIFMQRECGFCIKEYRIIKKHTGEDMVPLGQAIELM